VLSHESQFGEGESKVIKMLCFGKENSKLVSWQKLANMIQTRYICVSNQDLKNPVRKLSLSDLHYFYNRFFMSLSVNHPKIDRFLQW
jgi:hypothetical protein